MKSSKIFVMITLIICLGVSLPPRICSGADKDVTVVNTPANPVPVTISGTPKTKLIFNTDWGSLHVPPGFSQIAQSIDVSNCSQIRLWAGNRCDSGTGQVTIGLSMFDAIPGQALLAVLDQVTLVCGDPVTTINKVYDLPGVGLQIWADAGAGGADVDVSLWCR
jgi:hypothetical protein